MGEPRRKGQEGNRWVNEMPDPKDLAKWFEGNVAIHDGLASKDYVQGVTLIPATEKSKEVSGFDQDGNPILGTVENLIYVPYAKVETRVKYFNDLMENKASEWYGLIEPISPPKPDPGLPPGFSYMAVPTVEGKGVRFICCTMKVTVFEREGYEEKRVVLDSRRGIYETVRVGKKVIDAPPATKMIPVLASDWHPTKRGERVLTADATSLMKAETGAVGRALGMAGMLVIPGSGVATAEDMVEALSAPDAPEQPNAPEEPTAQVALPSDKAPSNEEIATLRTDAIEAVNALKNDFPDGFKLFQEWANGRGIKDLTSIVDPAKLRGITAKAKRDYKELKEAGEEK